MILSQMAVDLHMCCFHQFSGSWGPYCLDAWTGFLLNGCCRACCCRALAAIFSTNSHACVLHPNNAPENDADTIQIYIQISKFETTLNQWAKIQSGEKGARVSYSVYKSESVYYVHCFKSNNYWPVDLTISDCMCAVVYCDMLNCKLIRFTLHDWNQFSLLNESEA